MHFTSTEEFSKWVTFTSLCRRKYKMRPGITILNGRAVEGEKELPQALEAELIGQKELEAEHISFCYICCIS